MPLRSFLKFDEETGMRYMLVGIFIGIVGAVLAFVAFPMAGYWIALLGIVLVFVGLVLHWLKNWRSIFRIDG